MAILVGIDEAGYGPLLGPMVVSAVTLNIPDDLLRADLWDTLSKAVSAQKKALAGRLLITDSKKAYSRKSGIDPLRRTVLASLAAWNNGRTDITTAGDILTMLCPDLLERIDGYPWYKQVHKHELGHDVSDISIAGSVFGKTMAENNMRIASVRTRCLDVDLYNNRVNKVKNKSRVLFTELCSLVTQSLNQDMADTGPMQVIVDRQGGRVNYQRELLRMFPNFSLSVIRQDPQMSSYEMSGNGKTMKIHFCIKADTKYFVVCLASMVSKYVRELMMEQLNDYFCGQCENLKRTAGYWQDGQRFVKDLSIHLSPHPDIPGKLVRIS
jgi:ribonuclease HII